MAAEGKKVHRCPPYPPGWDFKFTGPEYKEGMSVSQARQAWSRFLRQHRLVTPCPRQVRSGPI
jgi:hypothetical protein